MSVIVLLICAGGTIAAGFLAAFTWAVLNGQFDDTATPAIRILFDADPVSSIATEGPPDVQTRS
jgi:cbb3-type cytochrome oxidase maturation protein